MRGQIRSITTLTGRISNRPGGGTSANSDHIMADLISERGIMITDSQICDYTIAEETPILTSSAAEAENESHTEYNKEVLL